MPAGPEVEETVTLKDEIGQTKPFHSLEEEAFLNLLRTTDRLTLAAQQKVKPYGITMTQYNVLRILRGAGEDGLSCSKIGELMVTHDPDVTRLLTRLEKSKLVKRRRNKKDRRQICTQISEKGLECLKEIDQIVDKVNTDMLGHLEDAEKRELIRLLEKARRQANSECEKEKTAEVKAVD